jgi:hypothetical protein
MSEKTVKLINPKITSFLNQPLHLVAGLSVLAIIVILIANSVRGGTKLL